jgi:hypothetical protein
VDPSAVDGFSFEGRYSQHNGTEEFADLIPAKRGWPEPTQLERFGTAFKKIRSN